MAGAKATTLTLRIEPAIKEGLRAVAHQEHRSLANMIEVMILDYCGRNGVAIPEQGIQSVDEQKPAVGGKLVNQ